MEPTYRYRAEVGRVIDGDTIDAVIDLGFYIRITERLRLEGLDTPGIHGVQRTSEEYRKGIEAKAYVGKRLAQNGNRMLVETSFVPEDYLEQIGVEPLVKRNTCGWPPRYQTARLL
jgi:micrococcal nuclease